MASTSRPRVSGALTPLWFVLLALVWGSSFLFIKFALVGLSPGLIVLFRLVLGAVTLIVVVALSGGRLPRDRRYYAHMSVVAVLLCVAPMMLYATAGQTIPSGLMAIYNATTPLMTLVIGLALIPSERLTPFRAFGIVLGSAGVVLVLGPWQLFDGSSDMHGTEWAQLACLLGAASNGVAYVWLRRFVTGRFRYDAPTVAATQTGLAALMMLIPAPFLLAQPFHLTPLIVVSVVVLGVFSTGIAYVWNVVVVREWGATRSSSVLFLLPVVGVVLGIVVLGETITWNQPVGGAIAILGILVSQGVIGLRGRGGAERTQSSPE
ncbi:DMT family transporter [Microbacterium sp. No. 7]|uniref:DMT family transporter n=1 Tax=Microbacterium sp. No. 7 TaxID=1714373 RepID=UPI0006ECE5AD|nr:DMT family transporter [Microbacterium sp. No. 7]ALJ21148.1 hypothetical protein AOA12_15055 [Microbacterium sp. No. 7]